ncbi:fibroblast growth factor 2 isoform X3 [Mobula birostris]|uniref:fibroblast growth factor 2 isoform X3 n=1 Tax=Mobula birostris TaxID=1983395 RepID=UPI003B27CA25
MAAAAGAGGVSTLPTLPDTGGNPFPPGSFKEPKRLYCKNGGYFLRILPDGRVDGTREKNDGNIKLQLQAESIGVISIKGICANRYLAMNEDGRLYGSDCFEWQMSKEAITNGEDTNLGICPICRCICKCVDNIGTSKTIISQIKQVLDEYREVANR